MRVIGFRTLCLFVTCCMPASVHAAGAIERIGPGTIDWNEGVVTATGVGVAAPNLMPTQAKAMAHRAAIAVGYRNLLETIKGVTIDSETTVENFPNDFGMKTLASSPRRETPIWISTFPSSVTFVSRIFPP